MATRPATESVALLSKLNTQLRPPYQIPSGTVAMFVGDFTSLRSDVVLDDYVPGKRHIVPFDQVDKTSQILYNIPLGTVVTLLTSYIPDKEDVGDLNGASWCVDLVGTGTTEALDFMRDVSFNDVVSAFFYRTVDLRLGAIEFFTDPNFAGRRQTIFLSEWEQDKLYSFAGWAIQDAPSAARWYSLPDRATAVLYEHPNGTGTALSNIKGWGTTKETAKLSDQYFNKVMSSFKWKCIVPVKEIVEPFTITTSNLTSTYRLTSTVNGVNNSSEAQTVELSFNDSSSQTITVDTLELYATGISAKLAQVSDGSFEGIVSGSASTKWLASVNFSYAPASTRSTSETKALDLAIKQTARAPPRSHYRATLFVTIGRIPPTEYITTAQRWYKEPLTGAEADPYHNGWYKRTEEVRIRVSGNLAYRTDVRMEANSIGPLS